MRSGTRVHSRQNFLLPFCWDASHRRKKGCLHVSLHGLKPCVIQTYAPHCLQPVSHASARKHLTYFWCLSRNGYIRHASVCGRTVCKHSFRSFRPLILTTYLPSSKLWSQS